MTTKFENQKDKIFKRIKNIPGNVILRRELNSIGSPNQISRYIRALIEAKELVKIGHGIYAKSYISENLKRPVIHGGFGQACKEALIKLGIKWEPGSAEQAYNSGQSTQVPARIIIQLRSRYRGHLAYGNRKLIIEKGINAK